MAYVIYYDEKGKLRKEGSWNSWRDKDIPNEEFENVPTSGFVLNKKVGDYCSEWNHRQAYCRIYDPRNFEFEITIENLLYILENTNSIKGKGLEGEFVYGWDGKDLVLMPVDSPDYKHISKYSDIIHNNESIKTKDLIVGATYLTKTNTELIYVGKFDLYGDGWEWYDGEETKRGGASREIPHKKDRYGWKYVDHWRIHNYYFGKQHWFAEFCDDGWNFYQFKSVPKNKFITCVDDKCSTKYSEIFEAMECSYKYSPYDPSKDEVFDLSLDDCKELAFNIYGARNFKFVSEYNGRLENYLADTCYEKEKWLHKIFAYSPTERDKNCYGYRVGYNKLILEPSELSEIHKIMKPKYIQRYLTNGKIFERSYELNEQKR